MCGIVYANDFRGKPVNNLVLDVFDAQRKRGLQGFGLFDGQEGNIVKSKGEDKILRWLVKYDSSLLLFHHRFPTSTPNEKKAAHPFTTKKHFGKTQYILVHNGHISNDLRLRGEHAKLGIAYQSVLPSGKFNDSEALLWDVALYLEGKQDKLKAYGSIAFICLKLVNGKLEKMFFGRNVNPLNLYRGKEGILLSSEGEGEEITSDVLYTWNYGLKRLTHKTLQIPRWESDSSDWDKWNSRSEYNPPENSKYFLPAPSEPDPLNHANETWDYEDDERWEEIEWEKIEQPSKYQMQNLALKYLIAQKGNFELAYSELEFDYGQIAEDAQTLEEYTEMRLYEGAMLELESDPEWINHQSLSSRLQQLTIKGVK